MSRQAVQYVLVLLLALTVNFALPRAMPGSPLRALGGGDVGLLSAADRAELLAQYGLDRPLAVQFRDYVVGLAQLDLGTSFADGRPVTAVLGERVGWTLLLVGSALALATLLGVAMGVLSAARRERGRDTGTVATFVALDAMPAFWTGMLLILAFSVQLGWLPTFGGAPLAGAAPGLAGVLDIAEHLILPLTTLVLAGVAQMFLVTRSSMMTVLGSGYLFLARAKGLPPGRVLVRHGMRNAALPVTTLFLLEVGTLVEGAVVVETVFAYPGLGRLMYEAVLARDFPVLQGGFLVLTVAVIGMNLLADLSYPLLDPRVRRSTAAVA
ncbi:MAG: ABC transporter permease [Pseudonocardia sp.]